MLPFVKANLLKQETPLDISVLGASFPAPGIPHIGTKNINRQFYPVSSRLPLKAEIVFICSTKQSSNYRPIEEFPSKMRGQGKEEEQLIGNQGQEKLDAK